MKDLKGKTAVVTGGASGIGRAIVDALVKEGMNIVIADVEASALKSAVTDIRSLGGNAIGVKTDVSDFDSVSALEAQSTKEFGPIHILCNNAGVGAQEDVSLWDLPLSDWRWTLKVNLWGVIHGVKAFVPGMIAHGEAGHVVNTSSGNGGLTLLPFTPIYSTSKSAVSALTEVLHYQLEQQASKIRASVLYPGPHVVKTRIFEARRNRPEDCAREVDQAMPPITLESLQEMMGGKLETTEPEDVASYFIEGIHNDTFYFLPESERIDESVKQRAENVLKRRNPTPMM